MSEQATETTDPTSAEGESPQVDETDWRAEAKKWEQRSKENHAKVREFEKQQQATMSEAERAISEAETRGRATAAAEYGKRLARTQFDAAAGRRNPDFDTDKALEFVDLARFLGDDGEPDPKAISAAVERLIPAASGAPSFDGGTRSPASKGGGMNDLIRKAAGLG